LYLDREFFFSVGEHAISDDFALNRENFSNLTEDIPLRENEKTDRKFENRQAMFHFPVPLSLLVIPCRSTIR
jgi:hypothetical protein